METKDHNKKKNTLKLLICYHKPSFLVKDEVFTPIHVGRANAVKRMAHESSAYRWLTENMIGDNTGENISEKNDSYNEMTAIYWAWKNYDKLGNPDYIGLMHYRRHFIFDDRIPDVVHVKNVDEKNYMNLIKYSGEKISDFIDGYDFLPHMGRVDQVYRHYIQNQRKEDIDLANEIVLEKYPEYKRIMKKYYAGNESNFCNMCIFSKKLFFRYCSWIFPILEEFERRTDMTEKRLFISERMTGLFIAKLMEDKRLRYKKLPIAFLDEPTTVPIALYADENAQSDTAIFLQSMLSNKEEYHSCHIYLFCKKSYPVKTREMLVSLVESHPFCTMSVRETELDESSLPLFLGDELSDIGKCIYVSGKVLVFKDLGEFYRICSVDDYLAIGVPRNYYDPAAVQKLITTDLLVLNLKRMRSHRLSETAENAKSRGRAMDINLFLEGQLGYIPEYFFVSEHLANHKSRVLSEEQKRNEIQQYVLWHPFLVYDELEPEFNFQGIFSIFWWDTYCRLPFRFQMLDVALPGLSSLCVRQQGEIDAFHRTTAKRCNATQDAVYSDNELPEEPKPESTDADREQTGENGEEWRTYGTWGKLKFYYAHNGLKQTVRYAAAKMTGRKEDR